MHFSCIHLYCPLISTPHLPHPCRPKTVLVLKQWWLDKILDGHKTLEIRSRPVQKHLGKRIWLAASGTGAMFGSVELVKCTVPLTQGQWHEMQNLHLVAEVTPSYGKNTYAYVLRNPQRLPSCISFERKQGAVIWQDV